MRIRLTPIWLRLFGGGVFVIALAIAGTIQIRGGITTKSHANTPTAAAETEDGNISGGASIINDASASNQKATVFGQASAAQYGFSYDVQYLNSSQIQSTLTNWKTLDAKWVRFQIKWSAIQPTNSSQYSWTALDGTVNAILAAGMIPLPVIADTPTWAYPSNCTTSEVCVHDATQDANYSTFVSTVAARYASKITNYEIWNEQNNPIFWQPAPNVARYVQILKLAYAAIHAAVPSATVVSGGLAPASDSQGGGWISPVTYLTGMYGNGAKNFLDAVAWHPYTWPTDPATQSAGLAWYQMSHNARSIMTTNGDSVKKIWVTEFGAPTCTGNVRCNTEATQASTIASGIAMWKTYDWAGPMIAYTYGDTCTDQTNPECYFGVTRADGSQKPAASVWKNAY